MNLRVEYSSPPLLYAFGYSSSFQFSYGPSFSSFYVFIVPLSNGTNVTPPMFVYINGSRLHRIRGSRLFDSIILNILVIKVIVIKLDIFTHFLFNNNEDFSILNKRKKLY